MPMTLDEMGGQLRELDLVFQEHAETSEIGLSFATRHYVDQDGENNLLLMLQLIEQGEFLRIFCPKMFRLKKPKHAVPLMRLLGTISRRMKMAHFDFDEKSGEVIYSWEFPLEDGQTTPAQLRRLIMAPVVLADTYGNAIRKVIKTGEIQLPKHPYSMAVPPKGTYPPGELADLMKLAGGVEGLRELLRERILRDKKRK